MKKKNIYIKSRFRFTAFIAIMIVFTVMGANTLLGLNDASGKTEAEYITVEIATGDTLWNIAEAYMPEDIDIRKGTHLIMEANNMDSPEINAGDTIKIPTNNF